MNFKLIGMGENDKVKGSSWKANKLTVAKFRLVLGIATSQKPGDRRDAWRARPVADSLLDQPVPNLPREYPRIVAFVLLDPCLDFGRGDSGLAAADHARPDAPRLLVPIQDLRHASVRHPQLSVRNKKRETRLKKKEKEKI